MEQENDRTRVIADPIRKCIYFSLICNVPVEATSKLVKYIGECLGSEVKCVPHPSTVARCAYELGILSDIQTAKFMLEAESLTLAWDATSLKGDHIDFISISSNRGFMAVATDVLPGGTGEDYADHLANTICRLATTYAKATDRDYTATLNTMVSKLKCTMTDRASVNHCAAVRLMNQLQIQLLELNCQMHPLECFASTSREALLAHEKSVGARRSSTFGPHAGAVNLIAAISKLRYKDGKGDPSGFKSFLRAEHIDGRLLARYVGNRLHMIFHLAASVFHLRMQLLQYLKRCSQQSLRLSVMSDLSTELFVTQLQVLGLFGKIITGPWMALIYTKESDRDHMGKTQKVLECIDFVNEVSKNPGLLMTTSKDGFGQNLQEDEVLASPRKSSSETCKVVIAVVAKSVHTKLEKQLHKYRHDPAYQPSNPEAQVLTASASVHNIACERGLGMIDYLHRRSPNATMPTLDAKVRAKLNKTLEWLESEGMGEHRSLVFARREGAKSRRNALKEKEAIARKVLQRQQQKGQAREMVERRRKF